MLRDTNRTSQAILSSQSSKHADKSIPTLSRSSVGAISSEKAAPEEMVAYSEKAWGRAVTPSAAINGVIAPAGVVEKIKPVDGDCGGVKMDEN